VGQWGGLIYFLLPILLLVWILSRGRKQQRDIIAVQERVAIGAQVMMASGIFGEVVAIEDAGVIVLEVAPGVRTRWTRRAVARVIGDDEAAPVSDDSPVPPATSPATDPDPPYPAG
jgi:preprotein translocase subunit YajC